MYARVFLSLGSNIGDRDSNLAQATMALSINLDVTDIQSSSYYESEPLYNPVQPNFLNSVVFNFEYNHGIFKIAVVKRN